MEIVKDDDEILLFEKFVRIIQKITPNQNDLRLSDWVDVDSYLVEYYRLALCIILAICLEVIFSSFYEENTSFRSYLIVILS
jgi:hypothetical protein